MSTPGQTDFSRQTIPESWAEAAAEAPGGSDGTGFKLKRLKTMVESDTVDLFTACLAGAAVAILSGVGWYYLQTSGVTTPWIAVAVGLALAGAVRLGGGANDSQTRGILALLFYIATAVVVIFLVTSRSYVVLYGSTPGWGEFEDELLTSRLTEPLAVVAWFAGATMSVWASKIFR